MDDWIKVLKEACERESQGAVAKKIGYSKTVVSQVLAGKYSASTAAIERSVRGVFMDYTLECPVLGEVAADVCRDHQSRPFSATNPIRVRLYKECQTCPNKIKKGGNQDG